MNITFDDVAAYLTDKGYSIRETTNRNFVAILNISHTDTIKIEVYAPYERDDEISAEVWALGVDEPGQEYLTHAVCLGTLDVVTIEDFDEELTATLNPR